MLAILDWLGQVTGSEKNVRTVTFEFEGASYEIDLGPKNQTKLRKVLTPVM